MKNIKGVSIINAFQATDSRGTFTKLFAPGYCEESMLQIEEIFFSTSKKGTLRGMHLQVHDAAHHKYVSCISGKILDIVTDLRPNSSTYMMTGLFTLSAGNNQSITIPANVAHGFYAIEDSTVIYHAEKRHDKNSDTGFNFRSLPKDILNDLPIEYISERDKELPDLEQLCNYMKNEK